MKIGIGIGTITNPSDGGGDTFRTFFIDGLKKLQNEHQFYFFTGNSDKWIETQSSAFHQVNICDIKSNKKKLLLKIKRFIAKIIHKVEYSWETNCLDWAVCENPVDFMLVLPGFYIPSNIPYAIIIWDCGSFEQAGFPEMIAQRRTFNYLKARLPFASRIFVGTETGKQEIVKYYGIHDDKISTVPFPVPKVQYDSRQTLEHLKLKNPFLFYPAQFWAHKNHITILKAIAVLKDKYNLAFDVVFTGSDKGNEGFVKAEALRLGVMDSIRFCGFVSQSEIGALYMNAFALVYVTCLGPDNLPPLEAMSVGCPVISSGYPGAEEQLQDAALFFDTLDEQDLAEKIKYFWENPSVKDEFVSRGRKLAERKDNYVENLWGELSEELKKRTLWPLTEKE